MDTGNKTMMNKSIQEKIKSEFDRGITITSEDDISSVMNQKEKAFKLSKHLGKVANDFKLLWMLLNDYKSGAYKEVPWKMVAAIIFSISYLLMPLDVIPDIIPIAGFTDDITVFGLVFAGFSAELDSYKNWKKSCLALPDTVSGGVENNQKKGE